MNLKYCLPILAATLCLIALALAAEPNSGAKPQPPDKLPASGLGEGEADLKHWTPNADVQPQTGQDFRKSDERIWHDSRVKLINMGPVVGGTVRGHNINAHSALCIKLGEQQDAVLVYEKQLAQCQAGWFGGITVNGARFGMMTMLGADVAPLFVLPDASHSVPWAREGSFDCQRPSDAYPAPREWIDFQGVHFYGKKTVLQYTTSGVKVLEHPWLEEAAGVRVLSRTIEVGPSEKQMLLRVMPMPQGVFRYFGGGVQAFYDDKSKLEVALIGGRSGLGESTRWASVFHQEDWLLIKLAPHQETVRFKLLIGKWDDEGRFDSLAAESSPPVALEPLTHGGIKNYPDEVVTSIQTEEAGGPYVLDHILPPFKNPWHALFYLGGVDFLKDGRVVVCEAHGDVWTISGLATGEPRWKRFATGLYQPLGLKVVDDEIYVIERGQITKVIDSDGDGEADFLQNVSNRWHSFGEAHSFDMGLETGLDGSFYFNKAGEWKTPTGASILRVSKDGSGEAEVFCTGLRHTNGLGVTPDGQVTCAGQQGNWTPSSRIDVCKKGGFYGLMEGAHQTPPPLLFDDPLVWLPMDVDSSSADQVFTPPSWGPLGNQFLHLSWGQCAVVHVLPDALGGKAWQQHQAAACAAQVPIALSGCARGRFSPHDGQLYLACLNGWQCRGLWDGALERVRYVGGDYLAPVAAKVLPGALAITFGCDLNAQTASDVTKYQAYQWNYWWSSNYGSLDYSPRRRNVAALRDRDGGHDVLPIRKAELQSDRRTVILSVDDLQPAMQTRVIYALRSDSGKSLANSVDFTIHRVPLAPDEAVERPLGEVANSAAMSDAEIKLAFKPQTGDQSLTMFLRQNPAAGYRLEIRHDNAVLHDIWRAAHPDDDKDAFPGQSAVAPAADAGRIIQPDVWNSLRIKTEGAWIRVWLNEQLVIERVENDTRAAHFGRFGLGSLPTGWELKEATIQRLP